MPFPIHTVTSRHSLMGAFAILALGVPALLAFNLPPSSTFLNQASALITWGVFLAVLSSSLGIQPGKRSKALTANLMALLLLVCAGIVAAIAKGLPWSLALSAICLIATAGLAVDSGAVLARSGLSRLAFRAFCIGLVVTGILSSVVGLIQVFLPNLADGDFVARTYIEGRAVGNMRQPNHLSSLLLWCIVAVVWLIEAKVVERRAGTFLALLYIFVVVLTASRTGALSMLLLLAWAIIDKRLSVKVRWLLLLTPVIYAVFWYTTGVWADYSHHAFGGETRFTTKGDISSSRWGIWSNTLSLIRMHPWLGVGFGEFNFAWTLTPFPGRPVAFFDHTHNLVLQFLVELGIPLGLLVTGLLLYAVWKALGAARRPVPADAPPGDSTLRAAAFVMVLLILLHSLLEYPLWYAYYLLPASFAFGLCLGQPGQLTEAPTDLPQSRVRPLMVASLLMVLGGAFSLIDYSRVVVIFAPAADDTRSLAQRIDDGRHSIFFSHHADYAAATTAQHPGDELSSFRTSTHYLLDARLMEAWAKALYESGDVERAKYVAQRLREFKNEQSAAFFAPCEAGRVADEPLPFQCTPPSRSFSYEDFR